MSGFILAVVTGVLHLIAALFFISTGKGLAESTDNTAVFLFFIGMILLLSAIALQVAS